MVLVVSTDSNVAMPMGSVVGTCQLQFSGLGMQVDKFVSLQQWKCGNVWQPWYPFGREREREAMSRRSSDGRVRVLNALPLRVSEIQTIFVLGPMRPPEHVPETPVLF